MTPALLLGVWEGTGTLADGRAFTARMEGSTVLSAFLQVDIVCRAGGATVHEERVLYHSGRDGLEASSYAANGKVMHWRVADVGDRLTLTRAPHDRDDRSWLWTIEARGEDALHEEFLSGPSPDDLAPLVVVDHRRVVRP